MRNAMKKIRQRRKIESIKGEGVTRIVHGIINEVVLVHLGYYNKLLGTGLLINKRNLFLTVLEVGSSRSGCQQGWVRAFF